MSEPNEAEAAAIAWGPGVEETVGAAVKLRVLQSSPAYLVRDALEHVLPQLTAVVKAAEALPENRYVENMRKDLEAALNELNKALS